MTSPLVLEGFTEASSSLDWRLGGRFWGLRGLQAFVHEEVPNAITNDGLVPDRNADLFIEAAQQLPSSGPLHVLELGLGSGVYARQFLDRVKARSASVGSDLYSRLIYLATDGSREGLAEVQRRGTLEEHGAQVRFAQVDALAPERLRPLEGDEAPMPPLAAVFHNYMLCVLPFQLLMPQARGGWAALHVQTCAPDRDALLQASGLTLEGLRDALRGDEAALAAALLPAWPFVHTERAFLSIEASAVAAPEAAEEARDRLLLPWEAARREEGWPSSQPRLVHSWGALQSLERSLALLQPGGVLIFSDYGWSPVETMASVASYQHFGGSCAMGLGFPALEARLRGQGWEVVAPQGGDAAPLHVRLLGRGLAPGLVQAFTHAYPAELFVRYQGLGAAGRAARESGDAAAAVEAWERMTRAFPESWIGLMQLAACHTFLRKAPQDAEPLLRRALRRNPTASPALWNELGDALYAQRRIAEAHEAFTRAAALDPEDARAHVNLTWTLLDQGRLDEALEMGARGLALDHHQTWRQALLSKLQEVLDRRGERHRFRKLGEQLRRG